MYIVHLVGAGRNSVGLLVRVLTLLEEVKETQRVHGSMLQSVMRQLSTDKEQPTLPEGKAFISLFSQSPSLKSLTRKRMTCPFRML